MVFSSLRRSSWPEGHWLHRSPWAPAFAVREYANKEVSIDEIYKAKCECHNLTTSLCQCCHICFCCTTTSSMHSDYSCLCMLKSRKEVVAGIATGWKFRVHIPCLCCSHCIDCIDSTWLNYFAENACKQFFLCWCPSGVISTVSMRYLQSANDMQTDWPANAEMYFAVKRKMLCMHAQSSTLSLLLYFTVGPYTA